MVVSKMQAGLKKAETLRRAGRHAQALDLYEKLQKQNPGDPGLLHCWGTAKRECRDPVGALPLFLQAAQMDAGNPEFHRSVAETLLKLGENEKAAIAYARLGNAFRNRRKYDEAVEAYDKSLTLAPGDRSIRIGRLFTAMQLKNRDWQYADSTARQIIAELGNGRAKTATEYLGLSVAYQYVLEIDKALKTVNKAIQLDPENATLHQNKSALLHVTGHMAEAWEEDEWRWHPSSTLVDMTHPIHATPVWHGEAPGDLKDPLLVIAEQGFGDTLQFCRYLMPLAQKGYRIVFQAQAELAGLMRDSMRHPGIRVIARPVYRWDRWRLGWLEKLLDHAPAPTAFLETAHHLKYSAWIGLMSLPHRFGTTPDTIPADVPYLEVPPKRVRHWQRTMTKLEGGKEAGKIRVGLVWGGSSQNLADSIRSLDLAELEDVLALERFRFYSLQKGSPARQAADYKSIIDLSSRLKNFGDTAAVIRNLDLVLTVDTSVAHLAGALNKPTWIMVPKARYWRWGLTGTDSPWYPSVRIFRQHRQGDWSSVIDDVKAALAEFRLVGSAG